MKKFRNFQFESPAELAVHFHADHVVMRHGRDFRCSRRNCEKVFPSRESLRAHIHAHFFGSDSKENNDHFHVRIESKLTTFLNGFSLECPSGCFMPRISIFGGSSTAGTFRASAVFTKSGSARGIPLRHQPVALPPAKPQQFSAVLLLLSTFGGIQFWCQHSKKQQRQCEVAWIR